MPTNNVVLALPAMPKSSAKKIANTPCACGCGALTTNRFAPGHDSKLRGWALRLERGIVTTKTFPGTQAQLDAAVAFLQAEGGHITPHSRPSVAPTPAASHDRKRDKRARRAARKAPKPTAESPVEQPEQEEAANA